MRFADFRPAELTDALHDALAVELNGDLPEVCGRLLQCVLAALGAATPLKHLSRRELASCAVSIVYQFMHSHGGHTHYFPMGGGLALSERDRRLAAKFRGDNHKALAREFGLSEMRVRQILWKLFPSTPRPQRK